MKAHASSKAANRKATPATERAGTRHLHCKIKKVRAPRIDAAALDSLEPTNPRAAGIDVGSTQNFVAVPAHTVKPGAPTVRASPPRRRSENRRRTNPCREAVVAVVHEGLEPCSRPPLGPGELFPARPPTPRRDGLE